MFKSKKELAQALLEGRTFNIKSGSLYYDEKLASPFRFVDEKGNSEPMLSVWSYYDCVEEELPWYTKLPKQGVLCRVWDGCYEWKENSGVTQVANITSYSEETSYTFKSGEVGYENAEPLSKEEIKEFLKYCD